MKNQEIKKNPKAINKNKIAKILRLFTVKMTKLNKESIPNMINTKPS